MWAPGLLIDASVPTWFGTATCKTRHARCCAAFGRRRAATQLLLSRLPSRVLHSRTWEQPHPCPAQVPGRLSFLAVDAAVRLLVTLISAHGGGAALLARALSVLTQGAPFDLKPELQAECGRTHAL